MKWEVLTVVLHREYAALAVRVGVAEAGIEV